MKPIVDLMYNAIEGLNKLTVKECTECNGTGRVVISCCGDNITNNIEETDLCPTCLEHCGDETEECGCKDMPEYAEWKDAYKNIKI